MSGHRSDRDAARAPAAARHRRADRARDRCGRPRRARSSSHRRGRARRRWRRPAARQRLRRGAVRRASSRSTRGTSLAKAIVLALALPVLLMARDEFDERRSSTALLLSSLYGVCLLLSADSFLTLFLGLELMSLPVYVLVLLAYPAAGERGGGAQVPGAGRHRDRDAADGRRRCSTAAAARCRSRRSRRRCGATDALARAAVVLVVLGVLPEGGDRAVPRLGAGRVRRRERAGDRVHGDDRQGRRAARRGAAVRRRRRCRRRWSTCSRSLPLASIVWGNLAAMRQASFRRMIAYSSIAHAGYLFYAFLGDGPRPLPGGRLLPARLRPDEPARVRGAAARTTTTPHATGSTT